MKKLAVFISGNGSNLEAIIKAAQTGVINGEVVLVVANRKDAYGLVRAKNHHIKTYVASIKASGSKEAYEKNILAVLKENDVEWIALAGYLVLLGPTLVEAYTGKIINIHPALLPAYKGLDSIRRAYEAGEPIMGVSVHYVDLGMDTGPIIKQASFEVPKGSSEAEVEAMVHTLEHQLYVDVLRNLFKGGNS